MDDGNIFPGSSSVNSFARSVSPVSRVNICLYSAERDSASHCLKVVITALPLDHLYIYNSVRLFLFTLMHGFQIVYFILSSLFFAQYAFNVPLNV